MSSKIKNKGQGENILPDPLARVSSDLKNRMFRARLVLAEALGHTPTLDDIAVLVAAILGEPKRPAATVVRQWLQGKPPRTLSAMAAVAQAFGVDAGWLYFAPVSEAPEPNTAEQLYTGTLEQAKTAAVEAFARMSEDVSAHMSPDARPSLRRYCAAVMVAMREQIDKETDLVSVRALALQFAKVAYDTFDLFLRGEEPASLNPEDSGGEKMATPPVTRSRGQALIKNQEQLATLQAQEPEIAEKKAGKGRKKRA